MREFVRGRKTAVAIVAVVAVLAIWFAAYRPVGEGCCYGSGGGSSVFVQSVGIENSSHLGVRVKEITAESSEQIQLERIGVGTFQGDITSVEFEPFDLPAGKDSTIVLRFRVNCDRVPKRGSMGTQRFEVHYSLAGLPHTARIPARDFGIPLSDICSAKRPAPPFPRPRNTAE